MTTKVVLPPGCGGLNLQDGTRYTATKASGGRLEIADRHVDAVTRQYGPSGAGLLSAGEPFSFGTRRGQLCTPCNRVWNAWNTSCPRCGAPTTEQEQPA